MQLKDSKYFYQIDLKNEYYQIAMKQEDIVKTAFNVENQTYVFNRMPFGLTNAPRTFQRAMQKTFAKLDYIKIFLDDILIHSKCLDDRLINLRTVFEILRKNYLKINFKKLKFAQQEVTYLGHVIDKRKIRPDTTRISSFKISIIKSKRDIQRIIGLLNWFRPYVKDLSKKLSKIYDKLNEKQIE